MTAIKPHTYTFECWNLFIDKLKNIYIYYINSVNLNEYLKKENVELNLKLLRLEVLEQENKELKDILKYAYSNISTNYLVKKVNVASGRSFVNRMHIILEKHEKVNEGDLVIDKDGNLIGKIINVSDNSCDVLLIYDADFRIQAMLDRSMIKVLLSGNESSKMNINYFLGEKINLFKEEDVYTVDNDVRKSGIYIGKVAISNGKYQVRVKSNFFKINYIIILTDTKNEADISN